MSVVWEPMIVQPTVSVSTCLQASGVTVRLAMSSLEKYALVSRLYTLTFFYSIFIGKIRTYINFSNGKKRNKYVEINLEIRCGMDTRSNQFCFYSWLATI